MSVHIIFTKGHKIVGAFEDAQSARELAVEVALKEYYNGDGTSHLVIEKYDGAEIVGRAEHVYGYTEESKRNS